MAQKRLEHIEYLRGLAALSIVVFHSSFRSNSFWNSLPAVCTWLGSCGWLGVHVFFAISGWCIAQRITSAFQRLESPWAYLGDRAARIYPTYWAAFAIAIALLACQAPFNGIPPSRNLPHGASLWFAEITLTQPAMGYGALLIVSWTLFYELTFYVSSAVALYLRRLKVGSGILLIASGLLCLLAEWAHPSGWLIGFKYWSNFFAGVLAWWAVNRKPGAAWIVSVVLFSLSAGLAFSSNTLVACLTAIAVAGFARFPVPAPGLLGRGLRRLGEASYSIYLIHVSLLSPYFNLTGRIRHPGTGFVSALWFVGILLGVFGGIALHRLVERRFERWRYKARGARPPE